MENHNDRHERARNALIALYGCIAKTLQMLLTPVALPALGAVDVYGYEVVESLNFAYVAIGFQDNLHGDARVFVGEIINDWIAAAEALADDAVEPKVRYLDFVAVQVVRITASGKFVCEILRLDFDGFDDIDLD